MGGGQSGNYNNNTGNINSPQAKGESEILKSSGVDPKAARGAGERNNFADLPKKLHQGRQEKHIPGSHNYKKGNSFFEISEEEINELYHELSGTGEKVGEHKERVDAGRIIGMYVNENGDEFPTTMVLIHYSKKGDHAVPAKPKKEKK